jgi:hypothetical protein
MVYIPCLCLSCFEMRHIYEDIVSLSITCCLTAGNLDIKSGKLTILVQHTVIPVHIQYLLFSNTQLFLSTSSTCYSLTHSYSCPHPVPVIQQHTVIPVHIQYLLFTNTQLFLSTSSTCYSPTHSYSCPHPVPVIQQFLSLSLFYVVKCKMCQRSESYCWR